MLRVVGSARLGSAVLLAGLALSLVAAPRVLAADLPPSFKLVSESANLRLFMDAEKAQFAVEDKRNGHQWESNPPGGSGQAGAGWSLFYTDPRRSNTTYLDSTNAGAPTVTPIPRGVALAYELVEQGLRFRIEYALGDDYLEIGLPEDGIAEEGDKSLVRFEPAPFFGAAKADAQGYMVLPDGAGALVRFRPDQPNYRRRWEADVYGPAALTFGNYGEDVPTERATMPVFGLVDGDAAFVGIVTEGQYDAAIRAQLSGTPTEVNRVGAAFLIRRTAQYPRRRGTFVARVEPDRIHGDRRVRLQLLAGPDASYVGMARAYHRYLVEEKGVPPLQSQPPPLDLRIFMGVERPSFPWPELIRLTTFDQAIEVLHALEERGVTGLQVTLVGWERDGLAGRWPIRLPPEGRLGGPEGLRRLAEYAAAHGDRLVVEDGYTVAFDRSGGFSARTDVVRGANLLPMTNLAERFYFLNPVFARERYVERDVPELAALGVAGVVVRNVGNLALADHNAAHPLDRTAFVQTWRDTLGYIKGQTGWVGAEGWSDYTVGAVDQISFAPLRRTNYELFDEDVPLLPIALHGLAVYGTGSGNLRADPTRDFLRMLEYGAQPNFELTHDPPLDMARTNYEGLFTSDYRQWADDVVREYQVARDQLGGTWTQPITDHRKLSEGVYETTYGNGTKVRVDYNAGTYQVVP